MSLPASQYSVLDAERIERVDDNTFRCFVYRLQFFAFEVYPVLLVRVDVEPYGCCIRLLSCKLEGSPLVEAQNEKFSDTSQVHAYSRSYRTKPRGPLEDGTVVSKYDGVEFTVKEGFFCLALAKVVKTMKKGEKVLLIVQPQYASGIEVALPPNTTLQIDLELFSWKTVMDIGDYKKIVKKIIKEAEGYEHPNKDSCERMWMILIQMRR